MPFIRSPGSVPTTTTSWPASRKARYGTPNSESSKPLLRGQAIRIAFSSFDNTKYDIYSITMDPGKPLADPMEEARPGATPGWPDLGRTPRMGGAGRPLSG